MQQNNFYVARATADDGKKFIVVFDGAFTARRCANSGQQQQQQQAIITITVAWATEEMCAEWKTNGDLTFSKMQCERGICFACVRVWTRPMQAAFGITSTSLLRRQIATKEGQQLNDPDMLCDLCAICMPCVCVRAVRCVCIVCAPKCAAQLNDQNPKGN